MPAMAHTHHEARPTHSACRLAPHAAGRQKHGLTTAHGASTAERQPLGISRRRFLSWTLSAGLGLTVAGSATAGYARFLEPAWLELRLEPETAFPWQSVTVHLTGHGLGFYEATVWLAMAGQSTVTHRWRSATGWTGAAEMTFLAPSTTGEWAVTGYGYGEVAGCVGGRIYYGYGGAGTRRSITLGVSGATVFLPSAARRPASPR